MLLSGIHQYKQLQSGFPLKKHCGNDILGFLKLPQNESFFFTFPERLKVIDKKWWASAGWMKRQRIHENPVVDWCVVEPLKLVPPYIISAT